MAGYGMSETGFRIKRLPQIQSEIEAALRAEFGPAVNLLPESVFGQIVAVFSDRESSLWEHLLAVYSSRDPNQAEGLSLDRVASMVGVTRLPAVATTVSAILTGTAGAVIPSGSRAGATGTDFEFELTEDATVGLGGTVGVTMTCTQTGAVPCIAGTLTTIVTPVFGWTAVTNPYDGDVGRGEETDAAFRIRRLEYLTSGAKGTVDAIRTGLINTVTGIVQALVLENDTDTVNGYGIPAHSIWCIVHGSGLDSTEVAEAIFDLKAAGIYSYGAETVSIEDSEGFLHSISFSFADELQCYLKIEIEVDDTFDQGDAMVVPVTIDTAEVDTYTLTLNGVDISYTAGGGDDTAAIAAALVDEINGNDGLWRNVTATDDGGGDFHVTARYEGNAFVMTTDDDRILIDDPSTEDSGDQQAIRFAVLAAWEVDQTVGEDVYLSRLYSAVHSVSGVLSAVIEGQTDLTLPLTWSAATIVTAMNEVATLQSYDIVIEVV